MILLLIFLTYILQDILLPALIDTGPVSLLLNVSTMTLGYYSSKWFRLNAAQTSSITIEVGLQNSTLSMFMALTLLENYKMSFTHAIYTLFMFFSSGNLFKFLREKLNTPLLKSDRDNTSDAALAHKINRS